MNELTQITGYESLEDFLFLTKGEDVFKETEISKDKYRIELNNSWLICMVFVAEGTENDVDVLYLSSFYQSHSEQKKLMAYAGFVIGQRVNKGIPFSKVEFEQK